MVKPPAIVTIQSRLWMDDYIVGGFGLYIAGHYSGRLWLDGYSWTTLLGGFFMVDFRLGLYMVDFIWGTLRGRLYEDSFTRTILHGPTIAGPL